MKGFIHSFESLAALDGEGLRYAVFLSGCPLRCVYCHNPDTWEKGENAMESADLVKKILRYKPYFGEKGGVTFSGGEPLLQAKFIKECAKMLSENGVNIAIDTSGAAELCEDAKDVLLSCQTVILDLKFWDDESYTKYTGKNMQNTLKTLDFLEESRLNVWIRTVIVPGINDSEEILLKYQEHIKNKKCVKKYELLPFHTMGFYKYEKLGIVNKLSAVSDMDKVKLNKLQNFVDKNLKKP